MIYKVKLGKLHFNRVFHFSIGNLFNLSLRTALIIFKFPKMCISTVENILKLNSNIYLFFLITHLSTSYFYSLHESVVYVVFLYYFLNIHQMPDVIQNSLYFELHPARCVRIFKIVIDVSDFKILP